MDALSIDDKKLLNAFIKALFNEKLTGQKGDRLLADLTGEWRCDTCGQYETCIQLNHRGIPARACADWEKASEYIYCLLKDSGCPHHLPDTSCCYDADCPHQSNKSVGKKS